MEKEAPNALDSFLGDLKNEEQDVFNFKAEVAPAEQVTEEVDEKPEPFHKNPKIKRFIEKEINKALESKGTEREQFVKATETNDDLSDVLTRVIGNDTPEKVAAIRDFKKALSGIKDEARNEALEYFKTQEQEAKQADKQAENALDESFDSIEETYGVDINSSAPAARKLRNEFITFVQRVAPKNSDGEITDYPDFVETFDVFQEIQKKAPQFNRAKDIASRSMARSTETPSVKNTQRTTWDSISRAFDKLSN